jgi:hypothetical protein
MQTPPRSPVIPAKAGIHFDFAFGFPFGCNGNSKWIPAFAGMTAVR